MKKILLTGLPVLLLLFTGCNLVEEPQFMASEATSLQNETVIGELNFSVNEVLEAAAQGSPYSFEQLREGFTLGQIKIVQRSPDEIVVLEDTNFDTNGNVEFEPGMEIVIDLLDDGRVLRFEPGPEGFRLLVKP